MSTCEDPTATIARLLKNKLRVVKDSGVLAAVSVSGEYQNIDALKGLGGQVTVGLIESLDQKIELSGKLRRRMQTVKVNIWATDTPNISEKGKAMRTKIVDEVNRVIRQNRATPNTVTYDFATPAVGETVCKAYVGDSQAAPNTENWVELSDAQKENLWYSDDLRHQVISSGNGEFATLLFQVKLGCRASDAKSVVFEFEGCGFAPEINGYEIAVWNQAVGAWQNFQTSITPSGDKTRTLTLTSSIPNYVDEDGYVWFFASTLGASDGEEPAQLFCDYVSCTLSTNGITYCDVASYRNNDRVDLKPPIYRTEFTLKSWFIENIGE
ncbi:MAG: hypothetical protein NWF01_09935 [Candidatus Bathyarchaeota archaeon]|nr:hypothetical protein [Candidatus Bathyarchaeota archaeon]